MKTLLNCLLILFTFSSSAFANIPITKGNGFSTSSACISYFRDGVKIHTLYDKSTEIGEVVWMSRKTGRVKAKYFAYKEGSESVIDRYNTWKSYITPILVTSGAYGDKMNSTGTPVGLTIDNGRVVNYKLSSDKDALVIVYATGGIAITNIEDADLTIRDNGNHTIDLNSKVSKKRFINWAKRKNATVFQTHLLIQDDRLKVYSNADKSIAFRKVLVLSRKKKTGELFHILYNIQSKKYSLYEVSKKILRHQTLENMEVIMAVNTDTGGANYIESEGQVVNCDGAHLTGHSPASSITNALVYYYK